MKPPTRSRGFTIVELVTTIVLVGILSAVAIPHLVDQTVFRQRGYVDEMAGSLRYAQRIAIATECPVRFMITAAAYTAFQRPLGNCSVAGAWNVPVLRPDGTAVAGNAPSGAGAAPNTTIIFGLAGNVTNAPPPPVAIGPFSVTVAAPNGLVTVQ